MRPRLAGMVVRPASGAIDGPLCFGMRGGRHTLPTCTGHVGAVAWGATEADLPRFGVASAACANGIKMARRAPPTRRRSVFGARTLGEHRGARTRRRRRRYRSLSDRYRDSVRDALAGDNGSW